MVRSRTIFVNEETKKHNNNKMNDEIMITKIIIRIINVSKRMPMITVIRIISY